MKKLILIPLLTLSGIAGSVSADTIYIDFGYSGTQTNETGWNNITEAANTDGYTLELVNSLGEDSNVTLEITDKFGGDNKNGITDGSSVGIPDTAIEDSLFAVGDSPPTITFTGLDPTLSYSFEVYASRMYSSNPAVRPADYTTTGSNTQTLTLDASDNTSNTITLSGITPTAEGTITLTIKPNKDNIASGSYTYLGALKITAIPEASSAGLLIGIASLVLIFTRRRKA